MGNCVHCSAKYVLKILALVEQCTQLPIDSVLPDIEYKTDNKLYNIQITQDQITAIINKLNS
jgi:hypothetical protein